MSDKISEPKKQWLDFNAPVTKFISKAIGLTIAWKLLYELLIKPTRIIDKWLTQFLTFSVAKSISIVFPSSSPTLWIDFDLNRYPPYAKIFRNGHNILNVADDCNGLELMIMYIGLIVLLPYSINRKLIFIIGWIPVLIATNIVRCTSLYWISVRYPDLLEFNHHYLFTLVMYIVIFIGWVLYTKKKNVIEA